MEEILVINQIILAQEKKLYLHNLSPTADALGQTLES